jgi:phosphoribosylformylglycinamidine synthase
MLMVIRPDREDMARAIFEKWELDFSVIGRITDTGRLVLKMAGETVADIDVAPLVENAPEYDRPWIPAPPPLEIASFMSGANDMAPTEILERLMASPHLASRRWIWEQYDHMVMADTVQRPGGDAAVVRVHGTKKGLAITTDCTPRYCEIDPIEGGKQAVAEAWRNLTAVGARPLAVTDNMNFGNPEKPEIMGQFAGCIQGMAEACRALDFPVVSGNVSLYNETDGSAILPTPVIGGVGLIDDVDKMVTLALGPGEQDLVLIGETRGHVGLSLYLGAFEDPKIGAPPPVDLIAERRHGDLVRRLIGAGHVSACHDVSDGGLLVALAEMALSGDVGAEIAVPDDVPLPLDWLFGEDQGRYIIQTADADAVLREAAGAGVPAAEIGKSGGASLTVSGLGTISVSALRASHEGWFPGYMAAP